MIWRIIAAIGAGTFIVTGFSVLTDPNCQTAGFSGARAVTITCYQNDFGDMSGQTAGLLSIAGGVVLGILALGPAISNYRRRKLFLRNLDSELKRDYEVSKSISNGDAILTSVDSITPSEQSTQSDDLYLETAEHLSATKKCSFCAEVILSEAIKCKHCGSSLLPNNFQRWKLSISRLKPTLLRRDFQLILLVSVLAIALFSTLWLNHLNDKENERVELANLKANGKICVSGNDGVSFEFGCKEYPQVAFEFCSPHKFINPYWDDDIFGSYENIASINNGILEGRTYDGCGDNYFLHRIQSNLKGQLSGDYWLYYLVYTSDSANAEIISESGGSFLVRINKVHRFSPN